jgi:hypothetical protein
MLTNLGDLYKESGHTIQGSFAAVSKPNFASKYSLENSRRDLHNALLCTVFGIHNSKTGEPFSKLDGEGGGSLFCRPACLRKKETAAATKFLARLTRFFLAFTALNAFTTSARKRLTNAGI